MSMTGESLRQVANTQAVAKNQVKSTGETLAHAFFDDPLMKFLQPDESRRMKFGAWFMSKTVELG